MLAGRFKIDKKIGQGGYGAVYRAVQNSVGRPCAIKVLSRLEDEKFVRRFEIEARSTSRLAHPHTVIIYDFGTDLNLKIAYLAMEFLDGESLEDKAMKAGVMSVAESLHIAHQIARSLDDAHANGLLHRDVKPQNVMILTRGNDPLFVKVIDFGLAKAILGDLPIRETFAKLTHTGAVVGTPTYMSPEQVSDGTLSGASDQYALGVLIYRILTGKPPFSGANAIAIASKHITMKALPLRAIRSDLEINSAFEDAMQKALSKKAEERFSSCLAFVEALIYASKFKSIDEVSAEVTMEISALAIAGTADTEQLLLKTTQPFEMQAFSPTVEADFKIKDRDLIAIASAETMALKNPDIILKPTPKFETKIKNLRMSAVHNAQKENISGAIDKELLSAKATNAPIWMQSEDKFLGPEVWPDTDTDTNTNSQPNVPPRRAGLILIVFVFFVALVIAFLSYLDLLPFSI